MGTPIDRSITFAAAGTQGVQLEGRFVRVLAADPTGVTIKPSPGSPLLRYVGQDIDAGPGGFKSLDVTVTVASTVRLCVSDTRQADDSVEVSATVSATVSPGSTLGIGGDTACANAIATLLVAGNANGLGAIICGPAAGVWAAGTVRVGGAGVTAASGIEIAPGEKITIATTAPIYAYNNSGAAITLEVLPLTK